MSHREVCSSHSKIYWQVYPRHWHTQRFFQVTVKHNDWFIQEARHCHTERFALVSQTYCQTDLPKTLSHREVCPSQTYWLVYSRHCHTVGLSKSKQHWLVYPRHRQSHTNVTQRGLSKTHSNTFVTLAGLSQTLSHREACPRHTEGLKHIGCQVYSRHSHTKMLVQVLVKHIGWFIQDTVTQGLLPKPVRHTGWFIHLPYLQVWTTLPTNVNYPVYMCELPCLQVWTTMSTGVNYPVY